MLLSILGGERQEDVDLNRKYNETFVHAKIRDEPPKVVMIDTIRGGFVFYREKGVGNEHCKPEEFDLLSHMPASGVYQVKNSVAVVRRLPERQHKDGACAATLAIYINGERLKDFGVDVFKYLYAEQKEVVLEEVLDKEGCHRLNEKYWVQVEKDKQSLFRIRSRLGSWSFGQFYWAPRVKALLNEEIKDELRCKL